MYQLRYLPANANAVPHMLLEELGVDAARAPRVGAPEGATLYRGLALLTNSQRAELMTRQHPDRLAGATTDDIC
jgi:hypothetical protein